MTQTKQVITKLAGQHPASGNTNDKVTALLIFEQICEYFPAGFDKFFKGLLGIAVQKSGLKKLTKRDLKHFTELKSLSLYGNKLETLESDLFYYNLQLEMLSVFDNSLTNVHPEVLRGLVHLKRIHFNANPCIDEEALTKEKIEQLKCKFIDKCPATEAMLDYGEVEMEKLQLETENFKTKESLEAVTKNFISTKRNLERTQKSYSLIKTRLEQRLISNDTKTCVTAEIELQKCDSEKLELNELIQELEIAEIACKIPDSNEKRCTAINLKVLKANIKIVKVRNIKQSLEISELYASEQQILFLPLNLAKFFPRIDSLSFIKSELITINDEAFESLNEITEINFAHNKLSEIMARNFACLVKLQKLNLSNNKIAVIEPLAFHNLVNIREIHLNHNLLTRIDSQVFLHNKNLQTLMLQNNMIAQVAANFFEVCCESLKILDLTSNQCVDAKFPEISLSDINEHLILNCTVEFELECRFELLIDDYWCHAENVEIETPNIKLIGIKGDHINNLLAKNVTGINVCNQTMEFLPKNVANFLPNLKKITIESSKLKKIVSQHFDGLKKVEELILKGNKLTDINYALDGLTDLKVLDLSHNSIFNLTESSFEKFTKLITINLSHNRLTNLALETISTKNVIEKFVLSHNQLVSIDPQIIKLLLSAKLIDFEGNVCIDNKFDATKNSEKKVMEMFGEISFKCVRDDLDYD